MPSKPHPADPMDFEPSTLRLRRDGWTADRQRSFIAALAESACVTEACRTVGMSTQSAYRLRRAYEARGFRLAWDAALEYGIRRLSDAVISRAVHGVSVPHYYKGEQIGEHRRYDERLAMFLLRYRDPLRYGRMLDKTEYVGHDELFALRLARHILEVDGKHPPVPPPEPAADPARDPLDTPLAGLGEEEDAPPAPPAGFDMNLDWRTMPSPDVPSTSST